MSILTIEEYFPNSGYTADNIPAAAKAQYDAYVANQKALDQVNASAHQGAKNQAYWLKVARLPTPPTAQQTLLSAAPEADAAKLGADTAATEARKKAKLIAARGTLFSTQGGILGGSSTPAGGPPFSLGDRQTLLS